MSLRTGEVVLRVNNHNFAGTAGEIKAATAAAISHCSNATQKRLNHIQIGQIVLSTERKLIRASPRGWFPFRITGRHLLYHASDPACLPEIAIVVKSSSVAQSPSERIRMGVE